MTGQSNFNVKEEKNRTLLLETKDASLIKKIKQIFSSPENIQNNLKFFLTKSGQRDSFGEKKFESPRSVITNGHTIFSRLLEYVTIPKVRKTLEIDWDSTPNLDCLVEDLSVMGQAFIDIRKGSIDMLCSVLKKLNFAQLRAILWSKEFQPASIDKESKNDGPMASMVEKILFFDERSQSVVFDYKLFINCLISPQMQETTSSEMLQIQFPSAVQLLNYLRTSIGHDFIIKADEKSEGKTGHVIALGGDSTTTTTFTRPNHFHYLLDCSESMTWRRDQNQDFDETLFPEVKKISKDIAEKIEEVATPSTRFSVYPIKDPGWPMTHRDYEIKKEEKALENCKSYIESLQVDSGTNLYGVLLETFQLINQHPEFNHIVVLVTDGEDQNEEKIQKTLFNQLTKICNSYYNSATPPQIFIVTIGRNVAAELTQKLSAATQATVLEIGKQYEIAQLFDFFKQMHLPMRVVEVLVKIDTQVKSRERVSMFTGHPTSLRNLVVSPEQTLELNGQQYHVSHKSSSRRKDTLSDKLGLILTNKQPKPTVKKQSTLTEYQRPERSQSF